MDNFIASKTDFRVRCKCMIGAGSVMGLSVGGLGGRWEFLVAGAPCTQHFPTLHVKKVCR